MSVLELVSRALKVSRSLVQTLRFSKYVSS